MPPIRHWLARLCASGQRGSAPSRILRNPRALSFDNLEDRLVPTATVTNTTSWRNETFSIDDTVVNSAAPGPVGAFSAVPQNASFGNQIGLNQLLASGNPATGAGYTVAVIDTGIDYNNPDLGGGWGKRVIGGYDFYNNDADPMDDNGHGTDVAGIIGASDATYSGVAPDVNFVALKVLGADGSGTFGMVSEALDWVVANRTKYNIVAVNMSLGSGNYTIDPYTFLEGDLQTLAAANVFIGVAAGNDYYTYQAQGLAFPAISPNAVSVGAVWDGNYGSVGWANGARDFTTATDQITSFTQRGPNLDILAPGAMVTSVYLGNTFKAMAGTSMATPVIVGSAVVIRQELDLTGHSNLDNQSSILGIMQSTGVTVVDNNSAAVNVPTTGLTFKRINLQAAVQYVEGLSGGTTGGGGTTSPGGPTLAAIGTQNVGLGGIVAVGLNAADPAGKPITLTANLIGYSASSALLYTLKQSLGLSYSGSYFTNSWGKNEKWLEGAGGTYYAILPNGEFRKWTGTLDGMMSPANLIATLDPTVYADPSLLWNAAPAAAPPLTLSIVGNQLTISAGQTAGTYTVDVTASDGTQSTDRKFSVVVIGAANGTVDHAPVWTPIADKTMHQGTLTVPLTATDPDGDKVTYSASVSGATGIGLVVTGSSLAITPPTGYQGTFTVTVTATDGQIATSTTFHVTVGNTPPTLTVPATVTATAGSKTASFAYTAADADGDPLTVSASVQSATAGSSGSSTLSFLKQSLGLTYAGSYFQNIRGLNEKWLISADRTTWYCLLPDGELRRYAATNAQMLSPTNLVATLDPSVYADPSKLWNATSAVAASATVKIANGQATVTVAQGYHGTVTVLVTVSDGTATVTKTVTVTF